MSYKLIIQAITLLIFIAIFSGFLYVKSGRVKSIPLGQGVRLQLSQNGGTEATLSHQSADANDTIVPPTNNVIVQNATTKKDSVVVKKMMYSSKSAIGFEPLEVELELDSLAPSDNKDTIIKIAPIPHFFPGSKSAPPVPNATIVIDTVGEEW